MRRPPVDVGALADFPDREIARVEVRSRPVGVLRWGGCLYAFADRCPHMGAPMCAGRLAPRLDARMPGDLEADAGTPVLACPWHGWEFALEDGRAIADDAQRLRTYPVSVVDGRVLVDPAGHGGAG